jgi:hypothetical protein
MRRTWPILAALLLLAVAPPALADNFASEEFRFSIAFPAPPDHPQQERLNNDRGELQATVDMFQASSERTLCAVGVQKYVVPAEASIADELVLNRDNFLKELSASQASRQRTFQGYPALEFTWQKANGEAEGQGLVVVVPDARRRVYVVATAIVQGAPDSGLAAAERCFNSFRID